MCVSEVWIGLYIYPQIGWFNIVGYRLRKGLLSGGSPALAKTFYPKYQEDDYKAIIKGKNGDNATFKALEPLLDKYIK